MIKCAVIINGFYTNEAIEHQVASVKKELARRGVYCDVIKGNTLIAHIEGECCVTRLEGYDFAIYLDKDIHTAKMLEKCGIRLFNNARAIELCDDKMLTYIALSGCGINMPYTISSPIMYYKTDSESFIDIVEDKINYPVVVKESFGSMGKGVHLARNREELVEIRNKLCILPHIYQQFVGVGGEDKRVIVIGGKAVAWMKRKNEKDFRSNIEHGGIGLVTQLTDSEKFMAEKVAEVLGLDYCGVDILTDANGNPCFCEANSNAFFRGIEGVTGVNVAEMYVNHILSKIKKA